MSFVSGTRIRNAGVANLALGAHQPLRHRRRGHEKRARDLVRLEAAQRAQRQRDLRLERQRRVAAGEDQPQAIVGDFARVVSPAPRRSGSTRTRRTTSSFSSNRVRRRMRSMALCRAVWMIQARGDPGRRRRATGPRRPQRLPAPPLRPRRSRRRAESAWRRSGPNRSDRPRQWPRWRPGACRIVKNFSAECRSGSSPFDLLMEVHT